ncbi:MAG: YodL domain-containing protein [Microthrixaceae bacterium]
MTTVNYRLYHNVSRDRWFGYTEDDPVFLDATRFAVEGDPSGPEPIVLDVIYARHNRDDRPDGRYAPSLSVGDVIALDADGRYFAVESFGFRLLDGQPRNVSDADNWRDAAEAVEVGN